MSASATSLPAPHTRAGIGITGLAIGMTLFALCAHQGLPWLGVGIGGLLLAAAALAWSGFGDAEPAAVLGLGRWPARAEGLAVVGVAIGIAGGLWHRSTLGLPLQPSAGVEGFVVMACLIGATEEVIYRGWVLGRARALGWPAAIVIAAAAHAAYKTALFAWPAVPDAFDLAGAAVATFAGGLVLGLLRVAAGSLWPALLAHIAFDFVVYRAVADAPWWVWG
jgi:membrane protease YdiL (CAAX protease family)